MPIPRWPWPPSREAAGSPLRADDFARTYHVLLRQLEETCARGGCSPLLLADAEGRVVWPAEPAGHILPPTDQITGRLLLTDGWTVLPVRDDAGQAAAYLGTRTAGRSEMAHLIQAQAITLGQLLQRERELHDMTGELADTYDQLMAMYEVSDATRSYFKLDNTLESVLRIAVRLSQVQHGFVATESDDGEVCCITYAWPPMQDKALIHVMYQAVSRWGHPVVCNTASTTDDVLPGVCEIGERCLVTPVSIDDRVVGVIGLLDKGTDFTSADRKLLDALAGEVGTILERARLQQQLVHQERMRRELEIAAEIQTGLFPKELPSLPGIDLAARSVPANEVGGDFYDLLHDPPGPLALVVGDVTSKGVPAAFFVTIAHTVLHSDFVHSPSPRSLLEQLNRTMYDDLTQSAMFVTLFVAYYHPDTRRLVSANAGHSPVLFYDARSRRCRLWVADGPPVGVLPALLSADVSIELHPGDVLVVMSDGFNETPGPDGKLLGIDPLIQLLEENAGQSAAAIRDRFFEAVRAFARGAPQPDDRTICVFKVDAGGSALSAERVSL